MKKTVLALFFLAQFGSTAFAQRRVVVSGFVTDENSRETLAGASVRVEVGNEGTLTNAQGFFSLQLPANQPCSLRISMVGYEFYTQWFAARRDERLEIRLKPQARLLDEVRVTAVEAPSQTLQMSSLTLPLSQLKTMPLLLGEKDPLKALHFMPGVQQGVEGSTAIFVRGGGSDQNLLLLDNAVVYNANHLFGFFSTFNSDAIKRIELLKGAFPARYGGRLSSVVDVQMKEGNREKFHGEGGIGLLSSRLTLEGPIQKGKSSFLVSGRRTYADLLMGLVQPTDSKLLYGFYDFNAKVNATLSARHTVFLSAYAGRDRLRIDETVGRSRSTVSYQNGLTWGNLTGSLRWNAVWGPKTFSNLTLTRSFYRFALTDRYRKTEVDGDVRREMDFLSSVRDWTLRADVDHFYRPGHQLRWGFALTAYRFRPREVTNFDSRSEEAPTSPAPNPRQNQEAALYAENESRFGERWTVSAGLRLSGFNLPTRTYLRPEPRLALAYRINGSTALKASYARMNQYVHQLSNTGVGLPTDLWVPAAVEVPPQQSDQVAVGWSHEPRKGYSLTLEAYHKWMRNVVNYREGANFIGVGEENPGQSTRWEDHVVSGMGWTYGIEAFAQKQAGNLTGWVGYTLAWSIRQFDEINGGKPFYARQDRRHDFKVVGAYAISSRISVSANWQFSTGNALSVPVAAYFDGYASPGSPQALLHYGAYNAFRAAAYHRLDVGVRFTKAKKWGERSWEVSIFNAYNRKNPYYYTAGRRFDETAGRNYFAVESRWLLPILPSLSYNFRF